MMPGFRLIMLSFSRVDVIILLMVSYLNILKLGTKKHYLERVNNKIFLDIYFCINVLPS